MPDARETFIVGIDGSDCARRAAEFAARRARTAGARVVLLGVVEWSRYSFYTPEELETRARDRSAEIARVSTQVLGPLAASWRGSRSPALCATVTPPTSSRRWPKRRGRRRSLSVAKGVRRSATPCSVG